MTLLTSRVKKIIPREHIHEQNRLYLWHRNRYCHYYRKATQSLPCIQTYDENTQDTCLKKKTHQRSYDLVYTYAGRKMMCYREL